mgnify:CR=1 FL=1
MSVHGLKPTFTSAEGYKTWKRDRAKIINQVSSICKIRKAAIRKAQKDGDIEAANRAITAYHRDRVVAYKLNSLIQDGIDRRNSLLSIKSSIEEQNKSFPMVIENCRVIDFHFNKKHLEIPSIPMWVAKTRGKTFMIHHLISNVGFSTKEDPDHKSTKGTIRFRQVSLHIDRNMIATINNAGSKD